MHLERLSIPALALTCALCLTPRAEALERADLLPPDSMFKVRISNIAELTAAVTNAPLAQMWKDKTFQDFVGNIDLREAFLTAEAADLGNREAAELQLEELQMLKGEVILGITLNGTGDVHFSALAYLPEADYRKSLDMDRRIAELSTDKTTFINHEFQGELIVESRTSGADAEPAQTSFQAHRLNTLLLSDERQWIEACLVKMRAGDIAEPAPETPGIRITMDGKRLMALLQEQFDQSLQNRDNDDNSAAPADASPKPQIGALMPALGLDQTGDMVLDVQLLPDRMELASDLTLGKDLKGILSLIDVRPVDAITQVPYPQDDLFVAIHSRYDLAALWREIPNIMRKIAPGSEMMLGMMVMSLGGMDPGRDIFAHLDSTYSRIGRIKDGTPEELLLWRLNNPEGLRQSIEGAMAEGKPLRAQLGEALQVEDFLDHKLYTFPDAATGQRSGLAVAGDHLLVGSAEMVRASIRSLGEARPRNPFMTSKVYNQLLRLAPRNAFTVGIVDWQRLVHTALKQDQGGKNPFMAFLNAQQATAGEGQDTPWSKVNWERFPPAQFFARFLGPSLAYAEAKDDRILSRFVIYYPEDL